MGDAVRDCKDWEGFQLTVPLQESMERRDVVIIRDPHVAQNLPLEIFPRALAARLDE